MCLFKTKTEQSLAGEAKPAVAPRTEMNTETPGYWCGKYSSQILGDVIMRGYDFQSPVYKGKIHRILRRRHEGGNWFSNWWVESESYSEVELVPEDELFRMVKEKYCWIDTKEEWACIESVQFYYDVFIPKKIADILNGMYSESFALLLASMSKTSRELVDKAITLYAEGLSPDMRAYLLLTGNKK